MDYKRIEIDESEISQEKFEENLETLPNEEIRKTVLDLYEKKQYAELEACIISYADDYFDNYDGENKELVVSSKGMFLNQMLSFIRNKASGIQMTVGVKGPLTFTMYEEFQSCCEIDESEISQEKFEENLETLPNEEVRKTVLDLYEKKQYAELEACIISYANDYFDNYDGENKELVVSSKGMFLNQMLSFIRNKASEEDSKMTKEFKKMEIGQDEFEKLLNDLPNKEIRKTVLDLYEKKQYDELEACIISYADDYFGSMSNKDNEEEINKCKDMFLDKMVSFVRNKASEEDSKMTKKFMKMEIGEEKFEKLLYDIPNKEIRKTVLDLYEKKHYDELESQIISYADDYFDSMSNKDNEEEINKCKEIFLNKMLSFIQNKASEEDSKMTKKFRTMEIGKKEFEELLDELPNKEIRKTVLDLYKKKQYDELESHLTSYANEYFGSMSNKDNEEEMNKCKGIFLNKLVSFIREKASEEESGSSKPIPKMTKGTAMAKVKLFILKYIPKNKKVKASELVNSENFGELENFLLENMDTEKLGEKTDEVLTKLSRAFGTLAGKI